MSELGEFDPSILDGTRWYYDPAEPTRVCNFIERYHWHFEAQHAGKPFTLYPIQNGWIHEFYGVKDRETGLDRYRYLYLESAKGLGKSPIGTVLPLYHFSVKDEAAPVVFNMAASYKQADIIFRRAKTHIEAYPGEIKQRIHVNKMDMTMKDRNALWLLLTGKSTTASGYMPSMIVVDELHEIKERDAALFGVLDGNLVKRDNSKCVMLTNAGLDQTTLCWRWHEKAVKEMVARREGKPVETDLLPLVYASDPEGDIGDPVQWYKANPLIGKTLSLAAYQNKYAKTLTSTSERLEFERLWLTRWTKQEKQWLDPADIKNCLIDKLPEEVRALPLWVGFDLGPTDDITAAVLLYVDAAADMVYVECLNWLPRPAADEAQKAYRVPYNDWQPKHITLVNTRTLGKAHKIAIGEAIIKAAGKVPDMACVDNHQASEVISEFVNAGWPVEEIGSSAFVLNDATKDFEARITSGRIKIVDNPCYKWQLGNCTIEINQQGLVKPGRIGGHDNNPKKIDAGMATMYALSRAHLYLVQHNLKVVKPKVLDLSKMGGIPFA